MIGAARRFAKHCHASWRYQIDFAGFFRGWHRMDDATDFNGASILPAGILRHRHHGEGVGARAHQDPAGAAADVRSVGFAQHRLLAGYRRQSDGRRPPCFDRRLRGIRAGRIGRFFPDDPAAGNRADRRLSADFRRMSFAHHRANLRARASVGGGAEFQLADAADRAFDRNRRSAGAAGRARRARAGDRRRLLSAWIEDRASPAVRRYRLEHRARVRADAGAGARTRARRSYAAGLVRRRRRRGLAPAAARRAPAARRRAGG